MSKQEAERLQTKEERRNKGETTLSRLWVISENISAVCFSSDVVDYFQHCYLMKIKCLL